MLVYCREAHAIDSFLPMQYGSIEDPITDAERREMAVFCSAELRLTLPAVVDGIDDSVSRAYGGWPERLYLIGTDGNVAYRGGPGPFGFDPDGFEVAIQNHLGTTDS